mgnify:CR=1 FL=1
MPNINNNPLVTKDPQGGGGVGYTGFPTTSLYMPNFMSSFATDDNKNLASLFSDLNQITKQERTGSTGGTSQVFEGNMDANPLIALNPYMAENVTSFNKGGNYNPPKYFIGGLLSNVLGGASNILETVIDPLTQATQPVFDAVGNVVDPVLNVASDVGETAGGIVTDLADTAITGGLEGIKTVGNLATDVATGVLSPVGDILQSLLGSGGAPGSLAARNAANKIDRATITKAENQIFGQAPVSKGGIANIRSSEDSGEGGKPEGSWVGSKENPYVTPNVDEELDYAARGMKYRYEHGGEHPPQNQPNQPKDSIPFGSDQGLYGPPPKEEVGFFGELLDALGKEVNDAKTYMSEEFPWDVYRTLEKAEKAGIPVLSGDFTKLKKKLEDGWLSTRDAVSDGAKTVWNKNMEIKKTVDDALESAWLTTRDSVSDFLGFEEGGKINKTAQTYKNPKYNKGGTDVFKNYMAKKAMMKKGGKFKPHMMYNKEGKAFKANKVEDHNRMKKLGYTHTPPKARAGMKRTYTNGGRF